MAIVVYDTLKKHFDEHITGNIDIIGGFDEHVQNITIEKDLGREELNELGRPGPYHRYFSFPVEINTTMEIKEEQEKIHLTIEQNNKGTIVKDAYSGREIDNISDISIEYDPKHFGPIVTVTIRPRESMFVIK